MMMMMDVIFTVSIDPTISTASFANLKNISCTVSNRLVYNGKRSVQYPSEKKCTRCFTRHGKIRSVQCIHAGFKFYTLFLNKIFCRSILKRFVFSIIY